MRSDSSTARKVWLPTGVIRIQARLNLNVPYDFHRSSVKQADTMHRTEHILGFTEEPPIATSHAFEVFLLDPAFSLAGMAGFHPLPQHSEYSSIESCEDPFGDDVAMVVCPSSYDRVESAYKKASSPTYVLLYDLLHFGKN